MREALALATFFGNNQEALATLLEIEFTTQPFLLVISLGPSMLIHMPTQQTNIVGPIWL